MIIGLDLGNSHLVGGIFDGDQIRYRFRFPSTAAFSSDTLGLFLHDFLQKNQISPDSVSAIALCSVVPSLEYTVVAACKKYLKVDPFMINPAQPWARKLLQGHPESLGADRFANAVAAGYHFPERHVVVVDFGTATTLCAISADGEYVGGAIWPGLHLAMQSLSQNTAKLSAVNIVQPQQVLGVDTESQIQSGLYYSQLGAVKEMINDMRKSMWSDEDPVLVATGGYAHLFQQNDLFTFHVPDLVLHGIRIIWSTQHEKKVMEVD